MSPGKMIVQCNNYYYCCSSYRNKRSFPYCFQLCHLIVTDWIFAVYCSKLTSSVLFACVKNSTNNEKNLLLHIQLEKHSRDVWVYISSFPSTRIVCFFLSLLLLLFCHSILFIRIRSVMKMLLRKWPSFFNGSQTRTCTRNNGFSLSRRAQCTYTGSFEQIKNLTELSQEKFQCVKLNAGNNVFVPG